MYEHTTQQRSEVTRIFKKRSNCTSFVIVWYDVLRVCLWLRMRTSMWVYFRRAEKINEDNDAFGGVLALSFVFQKKKKTKKSSKCIRMWQLRDNCDRIPKSSIEWVCEFFERIQQFLFFFFTSWLLLLHELIGRIVRRMHLKLNKIKINFNLQLVWLDWVVWMWCWWRVAV